jgi:hypothetical protein
LAAVNRNPAAWIYEGEKSPGRYQFRHRNGIEFEVCACPWSVGQPYPSGVTVTEIGVQRTCDMTEADAESEGLEWIDNGLGVYQWKGLGGERGWHDYILDAFAEIWDSIHRRDINNRFERGPWAWVLKVRLS